MQTLPAVLVLLQSRRQVLHFSVVAAGIVLGTPTFGAAPSEIHLAQGALVGETTATSAILQTRLTATPGMLNTDVPGAPGVARFEIATTDSFENARQTEWGAAAPEGDYIVKRRVEELRPATQYSYRVVYGPDRASATKRSGIGRFKTLPSPETAAPVSFVLTSCLNYAFFHEGTKGIPAYQGESFLAWLKSSGIPPGRFYIVCGDRHWKYHSRHATGFEEFCSGALNRENARLGRDPGDPKSTDPDSRVKQFYTDKPASGGFLHVTVQPASVRDGARIEFTHRDDQGVPVYQHASTGARAGQP